MAQHTIPIENISKLEITSTGGSLFLTGWNRDEIQIKDHSDQNSIKQTKTALKISFPGDSIINIPHNLPVIIKSVGGDAAIKGISTELKISSVGGDLTISDCSQSTIDTVGGDTFVRRIHGDLVIKNIGNDCLVDNIQGQLFIQQVGNDIQIDKVAGGIEAQAAGDGQVNISPVPWQAYRVEVVGNLSVGFPDDCNAELSLQSDNGDIVIKHGNIDEDINKFEFNQLLGEGGPSVILSAGGKVFVSSDKYSWLSGFRIDTEEFHNLAVDFSSQTAEQINNHLSHLENDLQESLSGLSDSLDSIGLSESKLKEIKRHLEETSHQAIQKAEIAAIKAKAKVEKNIAKAQRKAHKMKRKTSEFDLNQFLASQAEKPAVTEKERLLILEMLQEKKISLEEADELLKALEGKKRK